MKLFEIQGANDQLLDLIQSNCLATLKLIVQGKVPFLCRGMDSAARVNKSIYGEFGSFSGRKTPRESRTLNNILLRWVSRSPQWKHVPSREYSSSCLFDPLESIRFGKPFLIIPFDNVDKFAATEDDFNYIELNTFSPGELSFKHIPEMLDSIKDLVPPSHAVKSSELLRTKTIRGIISLASKTIFYQQQDLLSDIKELSDTIDEIFQALKALCLDNKREIDGVMITSANKSLLKRFEYALTDIKLFYKVSSGKTLYDFLTAEITPERIGVEVTDLHGLLALEKKLPSTAEVWFRGGYVYIAAPPNPTVLLKKILSDIEARQK